MSLYSENIYLIIELLPPLPCPRLLSSLCLTGIDKTYFITREEVILTMFI